MRSWARSIQQSICPSERDRDGNLVSVLIIRFCFGFGLRDRTNSTNLNHLTQCEPSSIPTDHFNSKQKNTIYNFPKHNLHTWKMHHSPKTKIDLLVFPRASENEYFVELVSSRAIPLTGLATQASHPVSLHGNVLPGIPADTVSVYLHLYRC